MGFISSWFCIALGGIGRVDGRFAHPIPLHSLSAEGRGMVDNCTESYFEQPFDHFAPTNETFEHRYFINDDYYVEGGPMFFYLGNEADVSLYVNATGLMWENAPKFGALVVFAEHRYYGKSRLFPKKDPTSNLHYLSR